MRTLMIVFLASLVASTAIAAEDKPTLTRHAAPDNARVYIISPLDGATVGQTFVVRFGLAGMGVAPSGVQRDHTGHHHLLIDADGLPPGNLPIPADAQHVHFGGGQTQSVLHLSPGSHTLQLLLGDARHVQFKLTIASETITVHVQ